MDFVETHRPARIDIKLRFLTVGPSFVWGFRAVVCGGNVGILGNWRAPTCNIRNFNFIYIKLPPYFESLLFGGRSGGSDTECLFCSRKHIRLKTAIPIGWAIFYANDFWCGCILTIPNARMRFPGICPAIPRAGCVLPASRGETGAPPAARGHPGKLPGRFRG